MSMKAFFTKTATFSTTEPQEEILNRLHTFKREFYYDGKVEEERFALYEYRTFDLGQRSLSPLFTGTCSRAENETIVTITARLPSATCIMLWVIAAMSGLLSVAALVMTRNVMGFLPLCLCLFLFLLAYVALCISASVMFRRFAREVICN